MPSLMFWPSSLAGPLNGAEIPNRISLSVTPRTFGAGSVAGPTVASHGERVDRTLPVTDENWCRQNWCRQNWCRGEDSNLRPTHYECVALPAELPRHSTTSGCSVPELVADCHPPAQCECFLSACDIFGKQAGSNLSRVSSRQEPLWGPRSAPAVDLNSPDRSSAGRPLCSQFLCDRRNR
jgi:hypothetical protein